MFFFNFQAKKVKFTILQKIIEIVHFFTFNYPNTLKVNEIHYVNHCKYINRVKAKQTERNQHFYE